MLLLLPLQDFHTWQLPAEALSNITALQLLQQEPASFATSQDNKRPRANKNTPLKVSARVLAHFLPTRLAKETHHCVMTVPVVGGD